MFLIAIAYLAVVCVKAIRLRRPPPISLARHYRDGPVAWLSRDGAIYPSAYPIFSSPLLLLVFLTSLWNVFLFSGRGLISTAGIPILTYFAAYSFFLRGYPWITAAPTRHPKRRRPMPKRWRALRGL